MVRQLVAICQVCVETRIYAGGYTRIFGSHDEGTTFDTVVYHCRGNESNLQDCPNQRFFSCSNIAVTLECVNSSGKTTS